MNDVLFRIRLKPMLDKPSIGIECIYTGRETHGRSKYSLRVTYNRKCVFEHNTVLVGSFAAMACIDGPEARKHAVSHVSMRPGDTDEEFFSGYTPEQLDFVNEFGEWLSLYRIKEDI